MCSGYGEWVCVVCIYLRAKAEMTSDTLELKLKEVVAIQ